VSEQSAAKSTGRPLGPTGEVVRQNIKDLRADRGISQRQLSERMKKLGRPIPALGIHRIENGERRVDADDLVTLSVALGVSPVSLLTPHYLTAEGGELLPFHLDPTAITREGGSRLNRQWGTSPNMTLRTGEVLHEAAGPVTYGDTESQAREHIARFGGYVWTRLVSPWVKAKFEA
jgi:transcriptional regulator with XRE-family HTH domain